MSNPVSWDPQTPQQGQYRNENIKTMQNQVEEVVGIMRSNVDKIVEREERLTELDQRANQLSVSASEFQTTSRRVKRKFWWQNIKMMLILGGVITIVVIIIIISTVGIPSSSSDPVDPPASSADTAEVVHERVARGISFGNQQLFRH